MAALTNPFDVLPANLFNLLSSQAGELQVHYIAILLRIYEMAEFNRFGLTRELVYAGQLIEGGVDPVSACEATLCRPITDDVEMQRSIIEIIGTQF